MSDRDHIIDQLEKLMDRKDWSETHPVLNWKPSTTTILAGLFLQTHSRAILEALRRMD